MADSISTAFHRALDNIGKCKGAADFRDWGGGMRQAMGLHALEMLHVLGGAPCSEPTKEREAWKKANNNLFSVLFFMTKGSSHITVQAHESKELGCVGDGAAAWNALEERFDGNTKEAHRACRGKLSSKSMKPGGDPVDHIATMDDLRLRLEDMGEKILDDTYAVRVLNSLPKEFEFIEQMHHRDRSFNLEQIKTDRNQLPHRRPVQEVVCTFHFWAWSGDGRCVKQRPMPPL